MVAVDEDGVLVAWMSSLLLRTVTAGQLADSAVGQGSLFGLEWTGLSLPGGGSARIEDGLVVLDGGSGSSVLGGLGAGVEVFDGLDLLREAVDGGRPAPGVVLFDCTGLEGENGGRSPVGSSIDRVAGDFVWAVLGLIQQWLSDERFVASRLVVLTKGAVCVDGGGASGLRGAPVWGLVRSAQAENPGRFAIVDVEDDVSARVLAAALSSGESQLAVRREGLLVPRVKRLPALLPGEEDAEAFDGIDPDGTILLTGGTGGLGGALARHLVLAHGARHLLLVSRGGGGSAGVSELESELAGLGAEVKLAACDVCDRKQLEDLLGSIGEEHPLKAVFHLAGVLEDGVLGLLSRDRVDRVLAPKLAGAWNLHELTSSMELSAFVMFSSAAATLGSAGQGAYAAANAFLDALAAYRRANGRVALSLGWGVWASEGMARGLEEVDLARMACSGLAGLPVEEGLELFDAALRSRRAFVLPMRLEPSLLRVQAEQGSLPAVMNGLVGASSRRTVRRTGVLARRLLGTSEGERAGVLLDAVSGEIARILGHASSSTIGRERSLSELGFDSLMAVELRNSLNELTGLRLPTTLVFDYPTPSALSAYLLGEILHGSASANTELALSSTLPTDEPIAIVGMSCRYPGGVSSPSELWDLVMGEVDAVSPFPEDRGWDLRTLYDPDAETPGTTYACEGGFIEDPGGFDPAFFGIGPREALAMDPQQRLLLETAWEALENAQIDPTTLRGTQTGVFAGVTGMDYGSDLWAAPDGQENLAGYWLTGSTGSVTSGRVSYALGLEGPAVSVDTACSSSLVALHLACQALRAGECSMALAGGVTVLDTPGLFVQFSGQRGMARDGRCKSFSDTADGVGWGEGVGVLVLERLSDARRHAHEVLAVVSASAVNQDGASNGLTAPNGPSQQRVIRQALSKAGLSPEQVDAVEGHGTGTTLGDPIEANALLATYGQQRPPDKPLWLGSVKSNIGHTVAAAGVAGVIKMVMAMHNDVLPPTLHVEEPSSKVDWGAGAVALLTEEQKWTRNGAPRRAGVSSFGISGTNAHVILEDVPSPGAPLEQEGPVGAGALGESAGDQASVIPWVLSGRGPQALRGQAARLRAFLAIDGSALGDVGLSLAGRGVFEDRAVVLGGERERLLAGLVALEDDEPAVDVFNGAARGGAVAFLFTGQGAQRVGMGRGLYGRFEVFREAFDSACELLDEHLGCSLRDVVFGENGAEVGLLDETLFTQTGLFALEVALFRLVASFGVKPDYLIGHSVGEAGRGARRWGVLAPRCMRHGRGARSSDG